MVYQGSMKNWTVKDTRVFQVQNSKQIKDAASAEETKTNVDDVTADKPKPISVPRLKIDFCGFRTSEKPLKLELYLHNTLLHIDKDQISGYFTMK